MKKIKDFIQKKPTQPLYLLVGTDDYFLKMALRHILDSTITDNSDLNTSIFDHESSPTEVITALETMPFMSDKKIIIHKNLEQINKKTLEQLAPFYINPAPQCVVALSTAQADKRLKSYKMLFQKAVVVDVTHPYENEVPFWIAQMAQQLGIHLNKNQSLFIQQTVGDSLPEIQSELNKLFQYVKNPKSVQDKELLSVISQAKINNVFQLTSALAMKNPTNALRIMMNLIEHGEKEQKFIAILARHFRLLNNLKKALKTTASRWELSRIIGVSSFFLSEYLEQEKKWSLDQLKQARFFLHDADKALKRSPLKSQLHIEKFIFQVC